jgi:hypothetical protein
MYLSVSVIVEASTYYQCTHNTNMSIFRTALVTLQVKKNIQVKHANKTRGKKC